MRKGGGKVSLAASQVEHVVAGKLVELGACHGGVGVDVVEEIAQGGQIRLPGLGQDGGVYDEDVGALSEVIGAVGSYDGLAELAHGGQDGAELGSRVG